MYVDGFRHITNMDYSNVVIDNMRNRHCHLPEMTWDAMDMLDMTYDDASYDVVLEKGTLDSLLVEERDPWRMSDENQNLIHTVLTKVRFLMLL